MLLRLYLVKNGIYIKDLADSIHVSRPHMSQIVLLKRVPTMKIARKIEEFTKGSLKADSLISDAVNTINRRLSKMEKPRVENQQQN